MRNQGLSLLDIYSKKMLCHLEKTCLINSYFYRVNNVKFMVLYS